MKKNKQHFLVLDTFRGVAALMIAIYHFPAFSHFYDNPFLLNANIFVDFFFVLSGFVIAYNYQDRLSRGYGLWTYMRHRFARVYPLHAFMLALFVGWELFFYLNPALRFLESAPPFTGAEAPVTILYDALLIQALGVTEATGWNGPAWSISLEFYTYLAFALAAKVCGRFLTPLALVGCLVLTAVVIWRDLPIHSTHGPAALIRCGLGFGYGVLIHALWRRRAMAFSSRSLASVTELGLLAATVAVISVVGYESIRVLAIPLFGLLIYVFTAEAGWISAALKKPACLRLGAYSYSIYMVHMLLVGVVMAVARYMTTHGMDLTTTLIAENGQETLRFGLEKWQGDLATILMAGLVIGVSHVTYTYLEKPARKALR